MLSSPALAAILRHLADEVEKVDAPSAPPSAPDPPPPPPPDPPVAALLPASAPAASAPQAAPAPAAGPKPVIDLGTIKGVQQAYNQIRTANFPKLEENGEHDAVMTFALKMLQAATGIPVTGAIDKITLDTIHKAIFGTPRT